MNKQYTFLHPCLSRCIVYCIFLTFSKLCIYRSDKRVNTHTSCEELNSCCTYALDNIEDQGQMSFLESHGSSLGTFVGQVGFQ